MASLGFMRPSMVAQNFPGSSPRFTEKNLPDLAGNVYIVTGSNAGVGKQLARILYAQNAAVYMACRSEKKALAAIKDIAAAAPASTGRLQYIHLDLGDLRSVKPAAEAFLAREDKLHALFNNAGVMLPPAGQTSTVQGYDAQLGTNAIGPFLLTQLLTPVLAATATPAKPTRVVWVASMAAELYAETHGVDMAKLRGKTYDGPAKEPLVLYGNSKAATYLHSVEYARRHRADNIISVAVNPGNLDSDLYRTVDGGSGGQGASGAAAAAPPDTGLGFLTRTVMKAFCGIMLHPPVFGAYTELFAGFSPDVTLDKSGAWIGPWGRFFAIRRDIANNAKPTAEGGRGGAEALWTWTVAQVKPFM